VNETFAVLAEPTRYRIVELLRSGPRGVNDIGEKLRLNQPQVSQHLKLLENAGFVTVEPRAQQRLYALHPSKEALDAHMSSGVVEGTGEQFDQLDEILASTPDADVTEA
jgi:DNA-binding transcriptional ArsR family regulator